MIQYITRRLLLFIPTLFAISLIAFTINVIAPGDPVARLSGIISEDAPNLRSTNIGNSDEYWYAKLGLHLPVFYLSVSPLSVSDDVYSIVNPYEQDNAKKMMRATGNPNWVMLVYTQLVRVETPGNASSELNSILLKLRKSGSVNDWQLFLNSASTKLYWPELIGELLQPDQSTWKTYIPSIHLHSNNQYHRWIFGDGHWLTGNGFSVSKGVIRGDFGLSYQTMQPIAEVIGEKIGWSLFFSLFSVLLAYIISIPVGIYVSYHKGSRSDKFTTFITFLLYSLPSFWLATILLMTFSNPDFYSWFPASGIKPAGGYPDQAGLLLKLKLSIPYLILPLICYTYSSVSFITRTLRASLLNNLNSDYIRTAQAKGLNATRVMTIHAFRNSLLPMITLFVNVFPMMLGGSVILESIFSIPGMGFETVQAVHTQNYPMVVAIFTITGLLTMLGYLVSDILYAIADPRVKFDLNSSQQ